MLIFTLLLCPIFIFVIQKNILVFLKKIFVKIIVSVLIIIVDFYSLFFICNFMGWSYPISYFIFILLNVFTIILIYFIKYFIKSKHKIVIVFILFALIITIGSIIIFKYIIENNQDNIITVNSNEIIIKFNTDSINLSKEYKGRILEIRGIIENIAFPKDFRPLWDASCIYFRNNIDEKTKIICYFDDIIVHDLEIGQEIKVRCKFKKYLKYELTNSVIFINGKIVE